MRILDLVRSQSCRCLAAWLLLLALTGCANRKPTPDFPPSPLPPFSPSGQAEMPDRWWTAFNDPALNSHVNQALGDNFTLAVALARLRAARALARREASNLFPDVDGIITTDSTLGRGPDRTRITWGFDAAYQVDLWGQIQSRVEAERLRADATWEDYHAVALSLAAEVTGTWFALIEAHAQLELLGEQIETNRTGLKAQELRFRPRVCAQPRCAPAAAVGTSRHWSRRWSFGRRIEVLEHQLAVLLGQLPQDGQVMTQGRSCPPCRRCRMLDCRRSC